MHLITVSPLARGVLKENLSYFYRERLDVGTIVTVSLRGKHTPGLVLDSQEVLDMKQAVKSAAYPIKKVLSVRAGRVFTPEFLMASHRLSDYYGVPIGIVMRHFVPEDILAEWEGVTIADKPTAPPTVTKEEFVLQAPSYERTSLYRAMIREEFAKRTSMLMIAPSRPLAEALASSISKGIEEYTFVLHGDLSKKELLAQWKAIADTNHPIVIVSTPSFLAVPRQDLGVVIAEHEHAGGYKSMSRPFIDARIAARFLAESHRAKFVAADTLLRVESLYKKEQGTAVALAPIKHRLIASGTSLFIDMKKDKTRGGGDNVFSPELVLTITNALAHRQSVFLFAARKGLSTLTVCGDCGTTVACPECERPLILHGEIDLSDKPNKKNTYHCPSCRRIYPSETRCVVCASWRLIPLGIGVERIASLAADYFPGTPLFAIDGDTVKSHKKGFDIARQFYENPGSILIGTEMALGYIDTVPVSGVVSLDTLFSIPDFRMNERIMQILTTVREKTTASMIMQSRKADAPVFEHAHRGTLQDFYRDEIELRKKYKYPPAALFIKIHFEGKPEDIEKGEAYLEHMLERWKPDFFNAFETPGSGREAMNAIIRLVPSAWPDKDLRTILSALPPVFSVDIDPDSIL